VPSIASCHPPPQMGFLLLPVDQRDHDANGLPLRSTVITALRCSYGTLRPCPAYQYFRPLRDCRLRPPFSTPDRFSSSVPKPRLESLVQPPVQIERSIHQPGFTLLRRHAIYSRCSFSLQGKKAVPQQINRYMVEQPPSITARYFFSCASDSTSRWTPFPPENSRDRLQVHLGCVQLSPSCPHTLLHTCLPARHDLITMPLLTDKLANKEKGAAARRSRNSPSRAGMPGLPGRLSQPTIFDAGCGKNAEAFPQGVP
jgi:hypothetical protein